MKVLITGADGFIGSLIRKRFQSLPWAVSSFQGDILSAFDIEKNFSNQNWDIVIHLAGWGAVKDCEEEPLQAYKINSIGTFFVADAIKRYTPKAKLIFASTGQVYDLSKEWAEPITEDTPVSPGNIYGQTKRAAELYIEDSFKSFDGAYVILRLFNHSHKSQRPDFFMPSIYQQILSKSSQEKCVKLEVGNMNIERDIGAVQDMVEAFYQVVSCSRRERQIYNLCSGVGKTLQSIVDEMSLMMKIDVKLEVVKDRVRLGEPASVVASCKKFSQDFSWSPSHATNAKELVKSFLGDIEEGTR